MTIAQNCATRSLNFMFRLSTNWAPRQQLRDSCLTGYSAYSPELPGCAATGSTRAEVEREMREAIDFHIEGLLLAGEPIPKPRTLAAYCEVAA
jgi:predicted RNase H-like HicB family nuclease